MTVTQSAAQAGVPAPVAGGSVSVDGLAGIDASAIGHRAAADIERNQPPPRWTISSIATLYDLSINDLLFRAQQIHRDHFDPNKIQLSTLLSIKTGGCEEDCADCPQSTDRGTGLKAAKLVPLHEVIAAARAAKDSGATRFCMGAAWRNLKDRHMDEIVQMIRSVKALGLETCATLGMLDDHQAIALRDAGLDYYNHNLDISPEFYGQIISTRTYQDRLDTLERVRNAGIALCCGGIVGLGETRRDRAGLLAQLANMDPYPESVPINGLVRIEGMQRGDSATLDPFELVRTIAVARITMPAATIRLSTGREHMDDALQALCFAAGANAIFYADPLLNSSNPQAGKDRALFARLGMRIA